MDVFGLRQRLVDDYADYTRSFIVIRDPTIAARVEGLLWPDPIVQLNPAFEPGGTVDELVAEGLHGHYRTKALILDVYRKMADAIAAGVPYETILDPPPADPSLAHVPTANAPRSPFPA